MPGIVVMVWPSNAIMIDQQFVAKLANQFRFQFKRERSRRVSEGCRSFEDFLGFGLQKRITVASLVRPNLR